MDNGIGLYIHIPFCKKKCYYCDFNSYPGMDHLAGSYFNALKNEMGIMSEGLKDRPVKTVFIGGGTPSLVDPGYISELLEDCSRLFNLGSDAEISMECNPGTLSFEKLRIYRQAGINRLSIGLQAWQDRLLESLGRIHRRQQFTDNLESAYKAGFTNINADLIFGLPGQTFEDWSETLDAVTSHFMDKRITHLSCYSLQIEEGTVFGDKYETGALIPADDELDRKMYGYTVEFLAGKGYRHYEISNFALPGYECRHNLIYWRAEEYASFGAGAHSYLNGKRYGNTAGIEEYIGAVKRFEERTRDIGDKAGCRNEEGYYPVPTDTGLDTGLLDTGPTDTGFDTGLHEDIQYIGRRESMSEFMILGLRLIKGVSSEEFRQRYGVRLQEVFGEKLETLVRKGLLVREETSCRVPADSNNEAKEPSPRFTFTDDVHYRLSALGLDLANKVFVEFI